MAGLTPEGLTIKTLADVVADFEAQASVIFSDSVEPGDIVDTSGESALGRIIGVVSPPLFDVWEAIQLVNDSFNPNAATGIALDNVISLSGITRLPAAPTRAQVVLEGSMNTMVSSPQGAVYSSVTQRSFSIVNPVLLDEKNASGAGITVITATAGQTYTFSYSTDGGVNYLDTSIVATASPTVASILAQLKTAIDATLGATFTTYYKAGRLFADRADPFQTVTFKVTTNLRIEKIRKLGLVVDNVDGPWPAATGSIDTISIPIIGWDSVLNPVAASTGRLKETDEELRERFRNSKFIQSANILESLLDALRNVSGVTDVVIYENDTAATDLIGVPMKSFMPIVLGGLPTDVATAIWQNKPTGIKSVGTTTVQIADSQSILHPISYKQPTQTPIYFKLNITNLGGLPGDAVALLKQAITEYGAANCLIGDDVVYSRFYTPINAIPGHQVNSFTMGTAPNPSGTANVVIPFDGVATFNTANVSVTITP